MGEKVYRPVLDDDEHLVRSTKNPNRYRGLSRDENNENPDIPEWEEIDLDDLPNNNSSTTSDVNWNDVAKFIAGIAIGIGVAKAYPYVEKWVTNTAVPSAKHLWHRMSSKSEIIADNTTNTSEIVASKDEFSTIAEQSLDTAFNSYKENMSSEEAQRELLEAFILHLVSIKKFQRVANADVTNTAGNIIDEKNMIAALCNEDFLESVNAIIRNNPTLLNEQQLHALSEILGYNVFDGKAVIPISAKAITDGLNLSML